MSAEWLIVLNADGTVLAVDGGAPEEWIGTRVEERPDISADLRRVASETRRQSHEHASHAGRVATTVLAAEQPVRILALAAVPVRRVPTDLRRLLGLTVKVMALQARAIEAALTLDVDANVPRLLFVDREKIGWVVTALIGNALRFVRRGTRLRPGGTIQVRARFTSDASDVTLEVEDDGSGIPEMTLSQLLQPETEGVQASGLALRLVQDVIAAHGGTVRIESRTDAAQSGTTVRLTLPCR